MDEQLKNRLVPQYHANRPEASEAKDESGMFDEEFLEHHGILGMRWGIRRYQNEDGTYTEEGRKRYSEYKEKVHQKAEDAQERVRKANEKYLKLSTRKFFTNDISLAKAKKQLYRATKKANKLTRKDEKLDREIENAEKNRAEAEREKRREVDPETRKKLTDILFKQLRENDRVDKNAKDLDKDTKASTGTIKKDTDLYVRDRIIGGTSLRILKENLDKHYYIVEPRKAGDGFAIIQRDGNKVNVLAYGREGLIKQDISGRTLRKIEEALEME